jgi:hypothetical protein
LKLAGDLIIKALIYITVIALAIFLIPGATIAGDTMVGQDAAKSGTYQGLSGGSARPVLSLLDMSRFHMSQSYTLSYGSIGGQGQMIGMYMNQIDYEFAKPLHVSFGIAYVHQPQGLFGNRSSAYVGNQLLPSFRVDWRPSKNFRFVLNYQSVSPYQLNYDSPFGRYESIFDDR